jgi:hypothetical protein
MNDWWLELSNASRIFWGIAIAASLFQLLIFAGSLFAGQDFDHSADSDHGNSSAGLKIFSLRAIVAFLVGFGWAGALYLQDGKPPLVATLIAAVAGLVFMGVVIFILRSLMAFRSDGTIDYQNAIGQTGHVYVTIPAHHEGQGQVEIMIQGRLVTALAVTDHLDPIPPLTPVMVHSVEGQSLLVVHPT